MRCSVLAEAVNKFAKSKLRAPLILGAAAVWLVFSGDPGRVAAAEPAGAAAARPNIIFFLTDDMRWDAMGCAGNKIIRTPNLDNLASQGTLFKNCFCTTSICAVSRASFLTGQYARRHRVGDFDTLLSGEAFAETFPALLRKAGYHTGFVGKWGLGGALPENEFDFWAGFAGQGRYFAKGDPEHMTCKLTRQALRFFHEAPAEKPFLLCMSFKAPHCQDGAPKQFQPEHRFESLYADATIPVPPTATQKAFEALPPFLQQSEGRTRWQRRFATPEMYQNAVKDYYRLITGVDDAVGQVVKTLDELKRNGNTAIIFTSDNGFFLGEHGLAGKWFMYEESIRLPLLIRYPQTPKSLRGRHIDPMVLTIDIAPTILDFAGVTAPAGMQGRSLKPQVMGESPAWREAFFYEHHFDYHGRIPQSEGVRGQRWKYTRYIATEPVYEALFDLKADPGEEHNLAGDPQYAATLEQMRDRWRTLQKQAQ